MKGVWGDLRSAERTSLSNMISICIGRYTGADWILCSGRGKRSYNGGVG